jgi:hypothetical protein
MNFEDIIAFTRSNQAGSIILRGAIWLIGVLLIATAVDKNKSEKGIRMDAGWFFLIVFSLAILSFLLFGFIPTF